MQYATRDDLIAFEARIAELWEAGELPYLLHLSGGNEQQLIEIFSRINEGDWIFSTHRNHYHALLAGIDRSRLLKLIRQGDSMFVFDRSRNFLSSAILAGTCCIAAGVAYALKTEGYKNHVWCFVGDGAEEQGHFYEAAMMVDSHDLPCTFIVEDNDRAVSMMLTERRPRGVPFNEPNCVERYCYEPTYPHAGNGASKRIEFKPR